MSSEGQNKAMGLCYKSMQHGLVASRDPPMRRHRQGVKWEPTSIIDGPMHTLMRMGDKHTGSS